MAHLINNFTYRSDWRGSSRATLVASVALLLSSCAPVLPGPDKQFQGTVLGAASGAGAGAITGFQVASATGPGAAIGAGFGAVMGGVRGAIADSEEDQIVELAHRTAQERARANVHEILAEQMKRRIELHPTREIYPADLFFDGDSVRLRPGGSALVRELARLNERRLPWSRLAVKVYVKAVDPESSYASHLAERRAQALSDLLVKSGLEPRRVVPQAVVVDAPVLVDPLDDPGRYSQAVELVPLDR